MISALDPNLNTPLRLNSLPQERLISKYSEKQLSTNCFLGETVDKFPRAEGV